MSNEELRLGKLKERVLRIACDQPERACAHAITKKLRATYGEAFTHSLEVGNALKWHVEFGTLKRADPAPKKIGQRLLYKPTDKAGFYLGLAGTSA